MTNINDIVLHIHMTYLNNKHSIAWISSFEDEIAPLSTEEFQRLIHLLDEIAQAEQANFMESIINHSIPASLQTKAADASNFLGLIEQLKIEYAQWKS